MTTEVIEKEPHAVVGLFAMIGAAVVGLLVGDALAEHFFKSEVWSEPPSGWLRPCNKA